MSISIRTHATIATILALALGSLACANAPTAELTESRSALRAAEEVGAAEQPSAAYHLELARDQIDAAEALIEDGGDNEYKSARRMLERAEVDAELAVSLARAADVRQEAEEARARVEELQSNSQ